MPRVVAFLIFPEFQLLDATGPIAAFEVASRMQSPAPYELRFIAVEPGLVRSSSGAALYAETLEGMERVDTLIVSGGQGTRSAMDCARTREFVIAAAKSARRICSVCSGSYVLAAAGLLDGRRATTHWRRSEHFSRIFPQVRLEADRIFVRDGDIWTSAGITAGIDLSLALIGEDLGDAVARRVAQELVVYHRRPGGQSQFSALLEMERPNGRFEPLLAWIRENLRQSLNVETLSAQACMSPRNFSRVFAAEMGITPAKVVERLRLEAARLRVECGDETVEQVAMLTGFRDAERMRRAFIRSFGQPPQTLRRAARAG